MTKRKSQKPKIDKLISRYKEDDDFKYRRSVGHWIPDHTREKLLDQGFSISQAILGNNRGLSLQEIKLFLLQEPIVGYNKGIDDDSLVDDNMSFSMSMTESSDDPFTYHHEDVSWSNKHSNFGDEVRKTIREVDEQDKDRRQTPVFSVDKRSE